MKSKYLKFETMAGVFKFDHFVEIISKKTSL